MALAMTTSIGIAVILFMLFRPKGAAMPRKKSPEAATIASVD
jgi:hypothetical protein